MQGEQSFKGVAKCCFRALQCGIIRPVCIRALLESSFAGHYIHHTRCLFICGFLLSILLSGLPSTLDRRGSSKKDVVT